MLDRRSPVAQRTEPKSPARSLNLQHQVIFCKSKDHILVPEITYQAYGEQPDSLTASEPQTPSSTTRVLTDEKGHSIKIRIASPPPQRHQLNLNEQNYPTSQMYSHHRDSLVSLLSNAESPANSMIHEPSSLPQIAFGLSDTASGEHQAESSIAQLQPSEGSRRSLKRKTKRILKSRQAQRLQGGGGGAGQTREPKHQGSSGHPDESGVTPTEGAELEVRGLMGDSELRNEHDGNASPTATLGERRRETSR